MERGTDPRFPRTTIGQLGALVTGTSSQLANERLVGNPAHSRGKKWRCIFNKQSKAQLGFVGEVGPVCVAESFPSSHANCLRETPPILGCN